MISERSSIARLLGGTALGIVLAAGSVGAAEPAPAGQPAPPPAPMSDAQWRQYMENTVRSLQNEVIQMKAAQPAKSGDEVKVTTKGGLHVETEDGKYSFAVTGRLQADGAWYDEDKAKLGDGTELRRARLGVEGKINNVWKYKFEGNFSDNVVSVEDAYLAFTGLKPVDITVGNHKVPFSLEEMTSSRFITFMERGLPNVFAPARHIGVSAGAYEEMWTVAAGVYGDTVAADPAAEGDEATDIGGRATIAPVLDKDRLVHVGIGAFYRDPSDSGVRFRQRPESHVTDTFYLDTGTVTSVDSVWGVDPEVALVYGPFRAQGEYTAVQIARQHGDPDMDLSGWYAYVSWFITGESPAAFYKKGKFDRVKPNRDFLKDGGAGAWEVAVRYSELDFNDGTAIQEGQENNVTVGLNWYPIPYVRFSANVVFVDNDDNAVNASVIPADAAVGAAGDDPTVFQIRAQVDW